MGYDILFNEISLEVLMEILWIVLGVLGFLILGGLVSMLIYTWPLSKKVYHDNLVPSLLP